MRNGLMIFTFFMPQTPLVMSLRENTPVQFVQDATKEQQQGPLKICHGHIPASAANAFANTLPVFFTIKCATVKQKHILNGQSDQHMHIQKKPARPKNRSTSITENPNNKL